MWFLNRFKFGARSAQWPKVRAEYLKTNPVCQVCGSSVKPEVHHIIPVHIDPSKELELDNLITLCDKYCHFIFGHLMNWRSYNPDIIKDAQLYYQKIKERP